MSDLLQSIWAEEIIEMHLILTSGRWQRDLFSICFTKQNPKRLIRLNQCKTLDYNGLLDY